MPIKLHACAALALSAGLAACAGGGGGGTQTLAVSQSPLPPTFVPGTEDVALLGKPTTQEFATAGAALRVRYDATTQEYSVMAPGAAWSTVNDDPNSSSLTAAPNQNFRFTDGASFLMTRASSKATDPLLNFQYSNLAAWGTRGGDTVQYTAFGAVTPAGAAPRSGAATYAGVIGGVSSVTYFDQLAAQTFHASVEGDITLKFDFAAGTLAGEVRPVHYVTGRSALPTLAFRQTIYAAGGPTFSGAFDTPLAGPNAFSGQFTGPQGEELIGAFAFPFVYPADGSVQSASGAFIAKR